MWPMTIVVVALSLGGYRAADHRRVYGAAADVFEEWLADTADDVEWHEVVDEPGGLIDVRAELTGYEGEESDLADAAANLVATVEQAGMVLLAATATTEDGVEHRLSL